MNTETDMTDPIFDDQYTTILRDYFAGQALAGLLAGNQAHHTSPGTPTRAYEIADELLEARQENRSPE